MVPMRHSLVALWNDECGQDIIEYALIAALVALVSIAGISRVGSGISAVFSAVGTKLSGAV